jgi:hypothetical protein
VHAILRDEVKHAQLGWAHLAHERQNGRGEFIAEVLPHMLSGSVRAEIFTEDAIDEGDPIWIEHGELPGALRLTIFARTLETVVFPGLEKLGVDTAHGRAWLHGATKGS